MKNPDNIPLVTTIKEHCRICYTCVRECPAKAIRIVEGQAEVMPQRCIGCGNCVRVCSQKAKKVLDSKPVVAELLASKNKVAAIIAPSFPAEFCDIDYKNVVGMIRKLGFEMVNEVAFGADLVARRFKKLLDESGENCSFIATTCPAIVAYIERYYPDLVGNLAPIVSPMIATARALKKLYSPDLKFVFIGPCIAKKGEAASENIPDEIDAVMTFSELSEMLAEQKIAPESVVPSEFDPPYAGVGAIFPVGKGLLQAAGIKEDLVYGQVVAVEGGRDFVDAIKEYQDGDLKVRLLEVLACNGCMMGPGMTSTSPLFSRRSKISKFAHSRIAQLDKEKWLKDIESFDSLDLSREFESYDQRMRIPVPPIEDLNKVLNRMGKFSPKDELNCGACGYNTCREHAVAIIKGLAESEMCLPYTIEQLHKTIKELATSNTRLASTQEALMQSEKLASMGQLAAGIAHEVNNPLGVVLMYANLLLEEHKNNPQMAEDMKVIAEQADKCKKIVAGLLNFARRNKVLLNPTDIYRLVEKNIQVMPAHDGIDITVVNNLTNNIAYIDSDQINQVLVNLISNAVDAMPAGGKLTIDLSEKDDMLCIKVIDTGNGIPEENLPKIFEPFFTTKEIGLGTGLGLSVTYGIVKMHRGDITVQSNANPEKGPTGTTFTVVLPKQNNETSNEV